MSDDELINAIPAGAHQRIHLLEEIVGPHQEAPLDWRYGLGWRLTGLVGPTLRQHFASGEEPTGWILASEQTLRAASLQGDNLALLERIEAAGLTSIERQ